MTLSHSVAAERGAETTRFPAVDVVRIAAAFFIVCFHSRVEGSVIRDIFYSGLVCFIIVSVVFSLGRSKVTARGGRVGVGRILFPWAFWSLIFLARDLLAGQHHGSTPIEIAGYLIAGTSIHLWYLPFILVVTQSLATLGRVATLRTLEACALAAIVAMAATAGYWRQWSLGLPLPLPQYVHAMFPVAAGIALYVDIARKSVLGSSVVILAALALLGFNGLGAPYLIGFAACFGAFWTPRRVVPDSDRLRLLADAMFGVYLVHPLLFLPCRVIFGEQTLVYPMAVFSLSLVIVLAAWTTGNSAIRLLFGFSQRR